MIAKSVEFQNGYRWAIKQTVVIRYFIKKVNITEHKGTKNS